MAAITETGSYPRKGKLDNEWKSFPSRPSGLLKKFTLSFKSTDEGLLESNHQSQLEKLYSL